MRENHANCGNRRCRYLTSGCCAVQDSCNVLLQQYLVELMDSGQHSLMPVYACHLRADERREVSTVTPLCHLCSLLAQKGSPYF